MNPRTVQALLDARGWSQADLAGRLGISEAMVSRWLQDGVDPAPELAVSDALGVPADVLDRPLPAVDDEAERAALLWDGLYPDLVSFAIAAGRFAPKAVGRLVQVHGMYVAARILGPSVWGRFAEFARFIHPTRRRQLEALVRWRRSRIVA